MRPRRLQDIRQAVQAGDNDDLITLFNDARDDLCTISGQPGR